MKRFEVGRTYSMSSPCMHDCVWTYFVAARTECTVQLVGDDGKSKFCRIDKKTSDYCKAQVVRPLGRYSMAPMLIADREAN